MGYTWGDRNSTAAEKAGTTALCAAAVVSTAAAAEQVGAAVGGWAINSARAGGVYALQKIGSLLGGGGGPAAEEPPILVGSGSEGWVYKLTTQSGMYIGRTTDIGGRLGYWDSFYGKGNVTARILGENLNYAEMRGLEQIYIQNYGLSEGGSLINKINGVSLTNPLYEDYMTAGWNLFGKK